MTKLEKINSMMQEIRSLCNQYPDLWDYKTIMYTSIGSQTVKDLMDTYAWNHAKDFTPSSQNQVYLEVKGLYERVIKWAKIEQELEDEEQISIRYIPTGIVKSIPASTAKLLENIEGFERA